MSMLRFKPSRFMPRYQSPKAGRFEQASRYSIFAVLLAGLGYWLYRLVTEPIKTLTWALGFVVVFVVLPLVYQRFFSVEAESHEQRIRRLMAERTGEDIGHFARQFDVRVVNTWVIRAVYEEFGVYIKEVYQNVVSFPLRADDCFKDLFDEEGDGFDFDDLLMRVSQRTGRPLEDTEDNPYYGKVETVRSIVLFFNAQPTKNW